MNDPPMAATPTLPRLPPAAGRWGNAGRTIRGPAQFGLNMGLGRSFSWAAGSRSIGGSMPAQRHQPGDVRGVNTPLSAARSSASLSQASPMRKVQSSLRVRF
jgi:hypothetical protein